MSILSKLIVLGAVAMASRAQAQLPVGELYASDANVHGSISLTSGGTTVLSGSSISSGAQTALLRLSRGGELRICTGTRVSIAGSSNGRDLMFSFGNGIVEATYRISTAADSIVTPDLRLLVPGPGEFDLAVGISANGDTCIRSSARSSGGVIVSEMMGDGTYQVKPSELVVFQGGRVSGAQVNPRGAECGCPTAVPPAAAVAAMQNPELNPRKVSLPKSLQQPLYSPPEAPQPEHVEADLRLSFSGDAQQNALPQARIMRLSVRHFELPPGMRVVALAPAEPPKKEQRGFWRKLGRWFTGKGYR